MILVIKMISCERLLNELLEQIHLIDLNIIDLALEKSLEENIK